ncbi:MAG TPA: type II secretion system protein GspL [Gammaproteobacteria bacterium]|nr:type II secretion system protein GspL [Gammaproteobacteria bacterium]
MAERLIIRLHGEPDQSGPVEWLVLDERNNRVGAIQHGELDSLVPQATGRRVIVFVPGMHVTLITAKLPSQNAQKVAQALPFALEERLAEDIDQLHFAAGTADASGVRPVAVVRRSAMDAWLGRLSATGLRADVLVPDMLLLPTAADQWHVAVEGSNVLVRTGPMAGFVGDKTLANTVVPLKLAQLDEADRPEFIVIQAADSADPDVTALAAACAEAGAETPEVEELPAGTAASLAGAGLPAAANFNLLQGPYRPRRDWEKRWRRWRMAAVLAGAWLVIAAAWQGVGYYRLYQQDARLNEAIENVFHQAMPGARVTADLRGRVQSRLTQLQSATGEGPDNGLLAMLGALGGGIGESTTLTTLSWHNGILEIQVTAPNVQTLGELRGQIEKKTGLNVQIESASAKGKTVDGRLRIGGRA